MVRARDRRRVDRRLFEWHQTVVHGGIAAAQRNCSVVVFDSSGTTVARCELDLAWPSKVVIAPLQMGPDETEGESATLVCEDVRRVAV